MTEQELRAWSEESIDYTDDNQASTSNNKVFKLSDEQQKIVDLDTGQHLVLAPPGTGKTEMLVHRLSKAIKSGIPQDKIACLTFTNRAATNMVDRVHAEIGDNDVFIGNIHSFCNQYLRENNLIPQITSLLDEEDQSQILYDAISEIFNELNEKFDYEISLNATSKNEKTISDLSGKLHAIVDLTNKKYFSKNEISSHLSYLKRKKFGLDDSINFGAANLNKSLSDREQGLIHREHAISIIYNKYENLKKESNYIDFDDLLTLYYFNLSKNNSSTIKWLQVDEAQDLNPFQWAIIDKIADKNTSHRVFFGDPEQAIFSFMGASQENLKSISQSCVVHYLQTNYRSPQYLLDLYNQYAVNELKVDWKFKPKAFSNALKPEGALRIKSFQGHMTVSRKLKKKWVPFSQYREADRIVSSEFPINNNSTAAILVRKNKDAEYYASAFKERHPDVKIFKVSGVDLFSRRITKDALAVLNIFVNNRDKLSWSRVIHMCTGQTIKKSRSVINGLFNAGINPIDILFNDTLKDSFLDDFLCLYNSSRVVIFDTETTGLDTEEDDIIQIAAIEIINGTPGEIFEVYIDTNRDFKEAEKIHHISKDFLIDNAINKHIALSNFIDFVGSSALIAHNLEYDNKILNSNLERTGLSLISQDIKLYDSVDIAQRLYPNLPRYKLEYLLNTFSIKGKNSHNAIDDVKATVGLVRHCILDIKSTKSSRKDFVNNETSKILEKFSKNFLPLYELLSNDTKILNLGDTVLNVVSYINNNLNYESKKYKDDAHIELKKLIKHMRHTCENNIAIKNIKEYIPDYSRYKEVDLKLKTDNVVIATIHKAKGLEFDYVIIPQCATNNYPGYYSIKNYEENKDDSGIIEDARLLYVAMTRAKKKLLITYSSDIYVENAGRYFSQKPSWFLYSIKELFSEETIK